MGLAKIIFAVLALILAAGTASAFVSGMEQSIVVGETPYDLSFYVQNDTATRQPFEAKFTFPTKFTIIKKPTWIEAGHRENVTVRIFPEIGFEGSTYIGNAKLMLGPSTAEKNIEIMFVDENKCNVESHTKFFEDGNVSITLENKSYKAKTLELLEIKNFPQDRKIAGDAIFTLEAYEKRTYNLTLDGMGGFDGTAELAFGCNGTTISEKTNAKIGGTDFLGSIFAVIGGTGKATAESGDNDFVLDLFLVIIASILLIAFIARMVKFASRGNGNGGFSKGALG